MLCTVLNNSYFRHFLQKGQELDYSEILRELNMRPITKLSDKGNGAVFKVSGENGTVFVLRIYDREIAAYKMLEGRDIPGIPKVIACRLIQGWFCAWEEYIDGVSLQEMVDGGARMDEERARDLTLRLCSALSSLHKMGIIHRDVKPEHVMLTAEGELYLIDLDAAMRLAPEKTSDTRLLGTAVYAAPEQFGLKRSDVRTDIFAVGILLNILLTGQHPAVQQQASGDLAKIIVRCTEMNPAYRYQDDEALISDLKRAVLSEQKEKRRKKRKFVAGLAGAALLILGILFFDILYYPAVVSNYVFPSDSNCIICTKESGNTYRPLESEFTESTSSETPPQIFLGENASETFYVLNRNEASSLTLPLLDFYREETGNTLTAETSETGTVKIGNAEYHIWKVKLTKDFSGAARVGLAFDGKLTHYNYAGEEDTEKTKFLWILDENYEEENFLNEHDGNIIPCNINVSGQKFNSAGALSNSEMLLGAENEETDPLTKSINMSLAPGDEKNAFYIVHPKGTILKSQSYALWAFGLNSSGYVGEGAGGRFVEKIGEDAFDFSEAGTVTIAGEERQVTRVALKKYLGHGDIETNFGLADETTGGEVSGFAGVRLEMGLNIVIESEDGALPGAEVPGINTISYLLEKAAGFEPETKPLDFVLKNEGENERYEAFLPRACALISDEGQGRILEISASPEDGWEISAITDKEKEHLAYMAYERKEYILFDADGQPVYDSGEMVASGWRYGMTGAAVRGSENRSMIDTLLCVAVQKEKYAEGFRFDNLGSGNRQNLEEFLKSRDKNGNAREVRKCLEYTSYTIYLDPADDEAENEIVFKLKGLSH